MQKKKNASNGGLVYSTDPNFSLHDDSIPDEETLAPSNQKLRVILDKKQRAGKAVTLVTGFIGKTTDLEELGKKLKSFCGTGGSVKEGEIIVQGDNREKVLGWLIKSGYTAAKRV